MAVAGLPRADLRPSMPNPNPLSSTGNNIYDPIPLYRTPGAQDNLSITKDGVLTVDRRSDLLGTLINCHAGWMRPARSPLSIRFNNRPWPSWPADGCDETFELNTKARQRATAMATRTGAKVC